MKFLLSLNFLFLFFFLGLPTDSSSDLCPLAEEEATVTTLVKICDFQPIAWGSGSAACNITTIPVEINNCTAEGVAIVRTVNLSSSPISGVTYWLPPGIPSVYYEFTALGQTSIIGPINAFQFNGEFLIGNNGHQYPLFEFSSIVSFDATNACPANPAMIPITVRLLDVNGGVYPIDNYGTENAIFSCQVFSETCDLCSNPPTSCNGGSLPVYNNLMACGDCNGCGRSVDDPKKDITKIGEKGTGNGITMHTKEQGEKGLIVQPNPFSDLLMIKLSTEPVGEVYVELFDSKGELIYALNPSETQGQNLLSIDTRSLSSGLYFCRIKIDKEIFVEKVVKLK